MVRDAARRATEGSAPEHARDTTAPPGSHGCGDALSQTAVRSTAMQQPSPGAEAVGTTGAALLAAGSSQHSGAASSRQIDIVAASGRRSAGSNPATRARRADPRKRRELMSIEKPSLRGVSCQETPGSSRLAGDNLHVYIRDMSIQAEVLGAALRICRARGGWTFRPAEIVAALPWINAGSVRTHVMSRCCANAPRNHAHRRDHFRRVARGTYEILPALRKRAAPKVAEARVVYGSQTTPKTPEWDPVLRAYEGGIDRTLLVESLKRSVDERLRDFEQWSKQMAELRGIARRRPR
jgi:hypothetical protein